MSRAMRSTISAALVSILDLLMASVPGRPAPRICISYWRQFVSHLPVPEQRRPNGPMQNVEEIWHLVEAKRQGFFALSDRVWETPELNFAEYRSAAAHRAMLEREGFRVTAGVAGMPTALMGEAGEGGPVIAILGEASGAQRPRRGRADECRRQLHARAHAEHRPHPLRDDRRRRYRAQRGAGEGDGALPHPRARPAAAPGPSRARREDRRRRRAD